MKQDKNHIYCPNCGAEYMPTEIYLPDEFLGKTTHIEKETGTGAIVDYDGKDMNLEESYKCDYCNTKFLVQCSVKFTTKEAPLSEFDKPHVTKYKKASLFLSE